MSVPPTAPSPGRCSSAIRVALALLLLAVGFPALRDYNVTWDEALGDFFFGERYLSFFTSFDARYLDFAANPYPADRLPDLSPSPFRSKPWEYYPAANLLAAASSRLFYAGLGVLDPFDGFHAANLFLGAGFVLLFYGAVRRADGDAAAVVACGLLLLSPRVVCHLLANIKDFPEMVLFAATLLVFHAAYTRRSAVAVAASGLLWGLALATKANALFIAPILGLFLLADRALDQRRSSIAPWQGRSLALWLAVGAAGLVAVSVMVALWPYLWADPFGRFVAHLRYVSGQILQVRPESVASPFGAVLLTTPPLFLLLAAVGLGEAGRRVWQEGDRWSLLTLIWSGVVIGRLYLPGAVNFDGVRHFLELFPALAMAAAQAFGAMAGLLLQTPAARGLGAMARGSLVAALGTLVVVPSLLAVVRTHPHQIAYWNAFAGGLDGARARGLPQAGDYWGMSYRQGLRWLDANAEQGAVLVVPVIAHAVTLVAPFRLRGDLGLAVVSQPHRPEIDPRRLAQLQALAAERPVYVMFVWREDWMNELTRDCITRLAPAAEWRIDGAPILQIYRYLPPAAGI